MKPKDKGKGEGRGCHNAHQQKCQHLIRVSEPNATGHARRFDLDLITNVKKTQGRKGGNTYYCGLHCHPVILKLKKC